METIAKYTTGVTSGLITDARADIKEVGEAAYRVVTAVRAESAARLDRDDYLSALVNALIGQPNPMTSKPHSATSAKEAAQEEDVYRAKDEAVKDAECARILAWADFERAKLTARLAVVAAGAE